MLTLFVHRGRKAIYGSFTSPAPITMPSLVQGSVELLSVTFIKDAASPTPVAPWDYDDLDAGETPALGLCGYPGKPTGTGTVSPSAVAVGWTAPAGDSHAWTAQLPLNTEGIATLIADLDKQTTVLEVQSVSSGGTVYKHAQQAVTVEAAVILGATPTPTPQVAIPFPAYFTKGGILYGLDVNPSTGLPEWNIIS